MNPAAPGFDSVVTAEFGDFVVGQVLTKHPGENHAHRVVRRAVVPAEPVALPGPEPTPQET